MKILLGSSSYEKCEFVKNFFADKNIKSQIILMPAESGISQQPLTKKETIQGAINRAVNIFNSVEKLEFDINLGIEGDLFLNKKEENYYLVCAASIAVSKKKYHIGVAEGSVLPPKVSQGVRAGDEFGLLIRKFAKDNINLDSIAKKNILELINRKDCFLQALELAFMK